MTPSWRPELDRALERSSRRLLHRGPDDEGILTDPDAPVGGRPAIALASRRLAIVDLTAAGRQPMTSADGRWSLVQNGEIYNYRELRRELEVAGVRFRSDSDTEVLTEAWAAWGSACLSRLVGMFALAAYDRRERVVWLARDHFGLKPLYWAPSGDALVFASEIAAVLDFEGVDRAVDPERLHDLLTTSNTDHGDGTLLRAVRQVPAGHVLAVSVDDPRRPTASRYWSLDVDREVGWTFEEAAGSVREAFLHSMELHLRSDAPVGFALSGGIDSSAVIMAARMLDPSRELRAISFIPDDAAIDEEHHVDVVTGAAGARTVKLRLSADDLRRDIDALTAAQGEPIASPVVYAQYRVMQAARDEGIKVMLGGQGADEILAGYDRYLPARIASLVRSGRWLSASRLALRPVTPYSGGRRRAFARAGLETLPGAVKRWAMTRVSPASSAPPWLDAAWFAERGVTPEPPWSAPGRRVMRATMAHNLLRSQIQALVRYEDRNAMAHSVENRVPFLTPPLVELLFSLPESHLLAPDGTRKAVFRAAMAGIVPHEILGRRDKVGFSVPMAAWFEALRPWLAKRLTVAAEIPGLVEARVRMRSMMLESGRGWGDPFLVWRWVSLASWVERFGATF